MMVDTGTYPDLDVIRHRPYLDRDCRDILNRAAREIYSNEPDWVEDPTDPDISEILIWLQRRGESEREPNDSPENVDTSLLSELFKFGLNADEAISWLFWRYSGLDPTEIYHVKRGVRMTGCDGIKKSALRNETAKLKSASTKLGEPFVEDRSNYMFRPGPAEAED